MFVYVCLIGLWAYISLINTMVSTYQHSFGNGFLGNAMDRRYMYDSVERWPSFIESMVVCKRNC
jgi:hypothetical protein